MITYRSLATFFLVASALVLVGGEQSWALDIVKDGQAVATIVVNEPPPAELPAKGKGKRKRPRRAAANPAETEVLVAWIKKITDVELPVAKAAPAGGVAIYVGDAAIAQGLKLDDIDSPSREGVRIVVDGRRILIAGQSPQATFKATCRFLEALGCRYFMDTPLGEVYPRTKTLSVAPQTITEAPGLTFRNPKGPTWNGGYWKTWNGSGGIPSSHAHSWDRYVSKKLFAQHPEFFAMGKDGVRRPSGWLCTSNPDLRQYFAQRVIDTISGGTANPSLSPPDGTGYCHCPACKAQDDPKLIEASSGMVSVSTRYADFFDDVARRVAKVHPKSMPSFYCYADYTQPPTLGRPLSPNLCAFIAPIRYCRLHALGDHDCPSRLQQLELVEGWSKVATHLGYYNYMYNLADATLPMFKFSAYKKEFPYLKDHRLSVMTLEVLSNWHIYGPQLYLGMRLAYDPKADADAIMEDYWTRFYGPAAAPHMKAYWMGIDAATERLTSHAGSFFGFQEIYTPEFLKQCAGHLAQAAEAAKTQPTYAARVALHAEGFRSAQQYREMCDAMAAADYHRALKILDAMTARLKGLASNRLANPEYDTSYLDRFVRQGVTLGSQATLPPARALGTLPDQWRLAFDSDNQGEAQRFHAADFDDSKWVLASTYGQSLSSQGLERTSILWYRTAIDVAKQHGRLTLYFTDVDGWSQVYVNGKKASLPAPPIADPAKPKPREIEAAAHAGQGPPRRPFEVDITSLVQPGRNVVAVRVDHTKLTELFLGGILRPVMLIDKGK